MSIQNNIQELIQKRFQYKKMAISKWYNQGFTTREIAEKLGISRQAVSRFIRKHILKEKNG